MAINPNTGREYTFAELEALGLAPEMGMGGNALAAAPGALPVTAAIAPSAPAPVAAPGATQTPAAAPGGAGANYSAALQDPEYLALLAQLDASLNNEMAEYDAQGVGVRSRYGNQLRQAGQQLPTDLKRSTESAAGRGMLYAGGLLEEQGDIQKNFANFNAQIGEDQTSELNGLERGRNAARSNYNASREVGLQGAVSRALARAQNASPAAGNGGTPPGQGGAPVGGAPVASPAPGTPAPSAPVSPAPAAPVAIPQNAGNVTYTPRPVTPQDQQQAANSTYAGPNDPTKAPGIMNPIMRPGDAPTPNSPLNGYTNPEWTALQPTTTAPVQSDSYKQPVYNTAGQQGVPQAAPVQGAPVQREMSSFSSKDQTVLSLGGTVKLGGVTPAKYNPLTGKVEPI